jgi:hypothetical protein
MLTMETIGRIRREHFVKGKTIKEITQDLKVSRNTVRKVLRSGETAFEYEREVQPRPSRGLHHLLVHWVMCERRLVKTSSIHWILDPESAVLRRLRGQFLIAQIEWRESETDLQRKFTRDFREPIAALFDSFEQLARRITIFRSEAMGCRPCYGTIDSAALAAHLRARSACARPQTSLTASPKTFPSASIDRVPTKIVGINVPETKFSFKALHPHLGSGGIIQPSRLAGRAKSRRRNNLDEEVGSPQA